MIVCDICGEKKSLKPYTFPMKEVWCNTYQGEIIDSFVRVVDTEIDLCDSCAKRIANELDKLRRENKNERHT